MKITRRLALRTAASVRVVLLIGGAAFRTRPIAFVVARANPEIPVEVFGLGTVEARGLSKLGFEVAGTLIELRVDHGDRVSKGAVLARLFDSEQKAKVAQARAAITQAEAAIALARETLA